MSTNGKKLVIGVTGPSHFSPKVQEMIEKFFKATPVSLIQNGSEDLSFMLKHVDAVILSGGMDICPTSFDEEIVNGENLSSFDVDRDRREMFIVEYAKKNNLPMFGICRGHQMLGKMHNLPFTLDISGSRVCHSPFSRKIDVGDRPVHFVEVIDEEYHDVFFKKELTNSFHHQAVDYYKQFNYEDEGVNVLGIAKLDYTPDAYDIVELMKAVDNSWVSCQWHPENDFHFNKASLSVLEYFKHLVNSRRVNG